MSMGKSTKLNIKEVQKSLIDLEKRIQGWVFEYDKELDYLYGAESKISKDLILIHPDKEFGFYITSKGRVKGFVFEYYFSNFVAHNDKFKEFENLVKENKLNDKRKTEVKHFLSDLSDKIITEITELEIKQSKT